MHPIVFTLPGGYPVYSFGVLLGLSLIIGFQLTVLRARRDASIDRDTSGNACMLAVVFGLLGARALYAVFNAELLADAGIGFWNIGGGGLMGAGGLVAGFAAAFAYMRWKRQAVLPLADAAGPGLGLGVLLTRLGSYLYGSDFGTRLPEDAPGWLASLGTFPNWQEAALLGSPAFVHHANVYGLAAAAEASYPVHPVQLYAAVLGLGVFGLALYLRPRASFAGQVFLPCALLYAVGAFALGYLRDDPDRGLLFDFSATQLVALGVAPLLWIAYTQARHPVPGGGPSAPSA